MTKTHLRGRYAVARFAVVGLRTVELSILLAGMLLAVCPCALALDPALDVSQYAHTAWRISDGFTKGVITSIAQTPDGYLWLGTELGLVRFDGVRAVPWQPRAGEQLPSNDIGNLLVARDGTLWIATLKGLASWKDGKLTQYPEVAGQVGSLLQDRAGTVWFEMPYPGRLCAIQSAKVQCYGAGSLGAWVTGLYEDRKGNLWVAGQTGLWRWTAGTPEHYLFPRGEVQVSSLIEDDEGALLLDTNDGLKQLVHGKIRSYALPGIGGQFSPNRFFRTSDGSLWVAIPQGLLHLHQGRADTFGSAEGLSGDSVGRVFEDREGSVWVITQSGLDRFREYAFATISKNQGLSTSSAWTVQATPDGSIWIGGANGLNRWENGHVTVYGNRNAPGRSAQEDQQELSGSGAVREIRNSGLSGDVRTLGQDNLGRLWVSTSDGAFYLETGRFVSVPGVPGGNIFSIGGDGHGKVWISNAYVGLFYLTPGDAVQSIPWSQLGQEGYGARALLPDRLRGGVWLGFYEGGVTYFKDGQVRASYSAAEGLGNGRVNDLRFGSLGWLWAATEGGLSRIKDGHVATLTSKNGLPCDEVHWIIEDDDHFFWVYMPCGLVRIARDELNAWVSDPSRKPKLTIFDNSDGVASVGVYSSFGPRVTKTPDGRIWFVHPNGVSVIDPRHLPYNKLPPPVHVEQITADRKSYDTTPDANGQVPLPARIRDLQIDYTALSLVAPEKVRFRYKLEGRDSDWQDAGNRRQAFYTDLPPRNYRFRVKACNNSGVWNEAGAFVDFSVAPAYYQTTWFRLSLAAAFLAVLGGLYQLRLRQLAREFNAGLEARVNERTRIARELHDSLLQGVQGLMFRLQAVREFLPERPSEATEALDIALKRGDKVIIESRDTVSDLRQSTVGDSDIAKTLTALGEELAAQSDNGAVPCVRVLVEGKRRELDPVLRDEIYRIAREAMRNAFRHAQAQKIEAAITYGDSEFLLHVRDDGRGIEPKVANQGARAGHWGLPGMRERAKRFGGQLEIWSEQGAGTEIELAVPAAIAYGKSNARPRFWFLRKKIGETDGQQS